MIASADIRRSFLSYFQNKGHTVVPSSSLVPGNDATLLFTNAGMVQFKDVFLGTDKRAYSRAATAQKCMRVSGKHNDLENVGPSPRHNTFFEMLGNFSFGDYFKRDAIAYAWEFLTEVVGLDKDRLYPTIYLDDDEAFSLWQEVAGLPATHITRRGKKDNFWSMGDTGPNGPCSEVHYDRGPEHCTCHRADCNVDIECERWWEIWNLVFMQYETTADGTTRPLPRPSIDTGMGFERLTAVLQGKSDNYQTDLFWPIIQRTQELLGHDDARRERQLVSYRVIADHARAIAFLMADGILPGNDGRNYVLRLILRRAARHGKLLGFREPFMAEVLRAVVEVMGAHYIELAERRDFILEAVTREEERFLQTLDVGLSLLDRVIQEVKGAGRPIIPGEKAFRLYDTYGFPLDLTRDVAKEHGLAIDEAGFKAAMEGQRERARAAQHFAVGQEEGLYRGLGLPATSFVGYEGSACKAQVLALVRDGQVQEEVGAGQQVQVVLDRTPLYGESGGQVGDKGVILGPRGRVHVDETRHPLADLTVHYGTVEEGLLTKGDLVDVQVDEERRLDIARNHTATHLLHRALQRVLGDHVRQAGSLVAPDRLRFDFTHLQPVSSEELLRIGHDVNVAIRADLPVAASITTLEEARECGAMALFGEKYGDTVRLISVGDGYSRELCGGTHLSSTGQIGYFHIVGESSVGSGLRRIEALTGRGAEDYVRQELALLAEAASVLQTDPDGLVHRANEMMEQVRKQQREVNELYSRATAKYVEDLLKMAQPPPVSFTHLLEGLQLPPVDYHRLAERMQYPDERWKQLLEQVQTTSVDFTRLLEVMDIPSVRFSDFEKTIRATSESLSKMQFRDLVQAMSIQPLDFNRLLKAMQLSGQQAADTMRLSLAQFTQLAQKTLIPREEVKRLLEQQRVPPEQLARLVERVNNVAGMKVVAEAVSADSLDRLREMADELRGRLGSGVIVLGAVISDRPVLLAAVTPDLVKKGLDASKLISQVAGVIGGGGGGRPTMAQAGGRDATKLPEALALVPQKVAEALARA